MTIVSITDFALHMQDYLDKALQGEKITIRLQNERAISLFAEQTEKRYTKADLLRQLSYQGGEVDSQQIDELTYG